PPVASKTMWASSWDARRWIRLLNPVASLASLAGRRSDGAELWSWSSFLETSMPTQTVSGAVFGLCCGACVVILFLAVSGSVSLSLTGTFNCTRYDRRGNPLTKLSRVEETPPGLSRSSGSRSPFPRPWERGALAVPTGNQDRDLR